MRRGTSFLWIPGVLAALVLGLGIGYFAGRSDKGTADSEVALEEEETSAEAYGIVVTAEQEEAEEEEESLLQEESSARTMVLDISDVVPQVMPAVVSITAKSVQEVEYWFRSMQLESESSGSGFIIDRTSEELLIATNAHVVEDAKSLSVCFSITNTQGESEDYLAEATIKGINDSMDLAVISVADEDIPEEITDEIVVAILGNSSELKVGQPAIAIGNALGYGTSVTLGIISALNREITIDDHTNAMIQTDAAINFGNSGGVLINTEGHVIGISSAKTAVNGVEGMGYAIPIDSAKPILEELMKRKTRTLVEDDLQASLGIIMRDISMEGRNLYHMPEGVYVYYVQPESAAEKAGLVSGDIITEFDGTTVDSSRKLMELLEYYETGEQVDLLVKSLESGDYEEKKVTVILD